MIHSITLDDRKVFTETYDIIMLIDEDDRKRIPTKFIKFLKDNKLDEYITKINPYIPLELQKINDRTRDIISYIYLKYLADEEDKKFFKIKEQKEEEAERKAYEESYNKFFNKKKKYLNLDIEEASKTTILPIEVKEEGFFAKIIKKIKRLLFKKI